MADEKSTEDETKANLEETLRRVEEHIYELRCREYLTKEEDRLFIALLRLKVTLVAFINPDEDEQGRASIALAT